LFLFFLFLVFVCVLLFCLFLFYVSVSVFDFHIPTLLALSRVPPKHAATISPLVSVIVDA